MIFGHLPFFEINDGYFLCQLFRISQQIQNEPLTFDDSIPISDDLRDLFEKILDKNPETRLTAAQVREHPWVKAACYESGFDPNAVCEEEEEMYQYDQYANQAEYQNGDPGQAYQQDYSQMYQQMQVYYNAEQNLQNMNWQNKAQNVQENV